MNKRDITLQLLRVAGYHNDKRMFTRRYMDCRVSMQSALEAYRSGEQAKRNGMLCTCSECNPRRAT